MSSARSRKASSHELEGDRGLNLGSLWDWALIVPAAFFIAPVALLLL
jgi:hypothetical protein